MQFGARYTHGKVETRRKRKCSLILTGEVRKGSRWSQQRLLRSFLCFLFLLFLICYRKKIKVQDKQNSNHHLYMSFIHKNETILHKLFSKCSKQQYVTISLPCYLLYASITDTHIYLCMFLAKGIKEYTVKACSPRPLFCITQQVLTRSSHCCQFPVVHQETVCMYNGSFPSYIDGSFTQFCNLASLCPVSTNDAVLFSEGLQCVPSCEYIMHPSGLSTRHSVSSLLLLQY